MKVVGEVFLPGNDVSVSLSPSTLSAIDPPAGGWAARSRTAAALRTE